MRKREIIKIDEELCNGCGLCVPSCAEGALAIVDGKAKIVKEIYCDGLGACLGECPLGALTIEVREADDFDEEATNEYLKKIGREPIPHQAPPKPGKPILSGMPEHLMGIAADDERLRDASLLIVADCVPFGYSDAHREYIAERILLLACPKSESASETTEKIVEIMTANDIKAIEVAAVENSTCYSMVETIEKAVKSTGKDIQFSFTAVTGSGEIEKFNESNLEKSFSC